MRVIETIAVPHRTAYHRVPDLIPPRAHHAVARLLSMNPRQRAGALLHVVDYGALTEICDSLAIKSRAEQNAELREIYDQVDLCRQAVQRRREWANGVETQVRREGEDMDRENLKSQEKAFPPSEREKQRQREADRLWKRCGVAVDIETYPAGEEAKENSEVSLKERAELRKERHFCDYAVGIVHNQLFPAQVLQCARNAWQDFPVLRDPFSLYDYAVCFVRELRFSAHGFPGREGKPAGFVFGGEFTDEPQARLDDMKHAYAIMPYFMAPGSSVLFDGCYVGQGEAGKSFLAALGELIFGPYKWGFLKANQTEATAPVYKYYPLELGNPMTYRWPDDFR